MGPGPGGGGRGPRDQTSDCRRSCRDGGVEDSSLLAAAVHLPGLIQKPYPLSGKDYFS